MNNKDYQVFQLIKKHYNELCTEKNMISFGEFVETNVIYKAILLDLLQIGENVNKFSNQCKMKMNINDLRGVTGIRNRLVHGYGHIDREIIWNTIKIDLPIFMNRLEEIFK